MSKSVYDLRRDEINELKEAMYWEEDANEIRIALDHSCDLDDKMVFEHYNGITFVADDFFCNCGDNIFVDDIEKMYDFTRMTKADFLKSYSYLSEAEYDTTKTVWDEWHTDEEISIEAVHAWRMAHYGYDCDND